ncbi:MAG: hypothetical protein ABIK62_02665, partial [candidate division WOR-3 bacterium]
DILGDIPQDIPWISPRSGVIVSKIVFLGDIGIIRLTSTTLTVAVWSNSLNRLRIWTRLIH